MAQDLITAFCKGEGRRFGGTVCEHFDAETNECRLLREHDLNIVFKKGRCVPSDMVKRALSKHLERYRDVVNPSEHLDAMAFEIASRLMPKRLKQGFQIYVLQGYINRTVYCSVIELLRQEEPLVKRQCGNCQHLSRSRPYQCQRATVTAPAEGKHDNAFYDTPRNITDRACQYGFDPIETTSFDASPGLSDSTQTTELDTSDILLADMIALLARRASETEDRRTKKRAERQYLVFCQLLERCKHGDTHQEAVKGIADDLSVSAKTIQREIVEVKTFFVQKGVLDTSL